MTDVKLPLIDTFHCISCDPVRGSEVTSISDKCQVVACRQGPASSYCIHVRVHCGGEISPHRTMQNQRTWQEKDFSLGKASLFTISWMSNRG